MKKILAMSAVFILLSCNHGNKPNIKKPTHKATVKAVSSADIAEKPMIQYTDHQLEFFLDSIGKLSTQLLANKEAFYADSTFKNQRQFDTIISAKDLNTLRHAIRKGAISVNTARRIFKNPQIDSSCTEKSIFLNYKPGLTPIEYYPFENKKAFDEYAICIGDPHHCTDACLYFFKGKKIIAMHIFDERFAQGLWHYKDSDGRRLFITSTNFRKEVVRGGLIISFINIMAIN